MKYVEVNDGTSCMVPAWAHSSLIKPPYDIVLLQYTESLCDYVELTDNFRILYPLLYIKRFNEDRFTQEKWHQSPLHWNDMEWPGTEVLYYG